MAEATGTNGAPDPDVVRRFHFTREMVKGPVYRKYKFAIDRVWNVDDLDFSPDAPTGSGSHPSSARGCSESPSAFSPASRPSPTSWSR